MPMACHPDDKLVIVGLQNLTRVIVCFNICLERIYYKMVDNHLFWYEDNNALYFNENSPVFDWADKMGKEVNRIFLQQQEPDWFVRSNKSIRL
jgi:hypothetical protein